MQGFVASRFYKKNVLELNGFSCSVSKMKIRMGCVFFFLRFVGGVSFLIARVSSYIVPKCGLMTGMNIIVKTLVFSCIYIL